MNMRLSLNTLGMMLLLDGGAFYRFSYFYFSGNLVLPCFYFIKKNTSGQWISSNSRGTFSSTPSSISWFWSWRWLKFIFLSSSYIFELFLFEKCRKVTKISTKICFNRWPDKYELPKLGNYVRFLIDFGTSSSIICCRSDTYHSGFQNFKKSH